MNVLDALQEEFKGKVSFVSDCFTVDDLIEVKNRVMSGEKIVLYNLDNLYNLFAPHYERYDGITHFYQRFTEVYRDRLWKNNKGQIHFVLSSEQLEQYYSESNHFNTMRMSTFDLTKEKEKQLK